MKNKLIKDWFEDGRVLRILENKIKITFLCVSNLEEPLLLCLETNVVLNYNLYKNKEVKFIWFNIKSYCEDLEVLIS